MWNLRLKGLTSRPQALTCSGDGFVLPSTGQNQIIGQMRFARQEKCAQNLLQVEQSITRPGTDKHSPGAIETSQVDALRQIRLIDHDNMRNAACLLQHL